MKLSETFWVGVWLELIEEQQMAVMSPESSC